MKLINLTFALTIFAFAFAFAYSANAAIFDKNNIISDQEMLDAGSMTLAEIDTFLKNQGGYISKNVFPNYAGVTKTAAQIIYEAANNYDCSKATLINPNDEAEKKQKCKKVTINPKLLIVLLQKEQSLITVVNPTERQLDWATGYGCPDGQACNERWRGFGRQVNSAALQFFDYVTNPLRYNYKVGNTYTVTNTGRPPSEIRPINNATAALYNYTPHVYHGNYNFHKLWLRYFSFTYPNNTLLQAKGEPGVWLIQNGKKRPFLSKGALTSRYDINKVLQVNKSVIDQYPKGAPIKFPQYSIVRSPGGNMFLLIDDSRRGFADAEAFRNIGYNPEEVMDASWEDINAYTEIEPITATSLYPTGALLQDRVSGGVYFVTEGTKAPLWDASLLKTKYKWKSITQESPEKLASYKTVEPAIFSDGELLKANNSPAVYVIDNKKKRPIVSGKVFEGLGYSWGNIIIVPSKIIDIYEDGEPMKDMFAEAEENEEVETIDDEVDSDNDEASKNTSTGTGSTSPNLDEELNSILNP